MSRQIGELMERVWLIPCYQSSRVLFLTPSFLSMMLLGLWSLTPLHQVIPCSIFLFPSSVQCRVCIVVGISLHRLCAFSFLSYCPSYGISSAVVVQHVGHWQLFHGPRMYLTQLLDAKFAAVEKCLRTACVLYSRLKLVWKVLEDDLANGIHVDSSEKFSRHLIIHIPGAAFKDNSHVGAFVGEVSWITCSLLSYYQLCLQNWSI